MPPFNRFEYFESYSSQDFDITKIVDTYKGKSLEDLFNKQQVISTGLGDLLEISWDIFNDIPSLNLSHTRVNVLKNLKTVYYIGEHTENYLYKRGVRNLFDLLSHLKYSKFAKTIIKQVNNKDFYSLTQNKYLYDIDTSFCFSKQDFLFIDIETLGIYDSPIILVGIGFFKKEKYHILQFFARGIEEEIAICEHLRKNIFPRFKCFVSYNGKSFDIPYLANRFLYYFDANPMISEDDTPYKDYNTKYGHIDLYHNCRRKYKGQYENYKLTTIEEQLLNWKRDNELPSNLVGLCYRKYLKDPHTYIGLIKECIEHNYYDILSLPLIFSKLLEK
ncbi:MAG: hypothetical protein BAJALOKI1v1_1180002 [Promethearchaeota archaeon]|nr:MAG: hypothetical protein BAJALOKI1v1_1180002 [Candidatus Lokiarchaeota archaeon]